MHDQRITPIYRQIRREQGWSALHAFRVAKVLAAIDWQDQRGEMYEPFAIGVMPDGAAIAVYWDDEPFDWGDMEPTERERENLTVIGCAARVAGEEDDLEAVWGYGFIHDGSHYGSDWEREAVSFALECGFFDRAREEIAERAEWAARDVMTVEA